jgi:hypothetical protein
MIPPRLRDGEVSFRQLHAWASTFDAISAGESWPARAFVDWLTAELVVA